jgi:hypothetical protein
MLLCESVTYMYRSVVGSVIDFGDVVGGGVFFGYYGGLTSRLEDLSSCFAPWTPSEGQISAV